MQEKTIKSILTKKFNDWVSSITDMEVQKAVKDNSIISGGAITSLLLNNKPNDYDIYFRDKETLLKVCHYYADKFNANHPFMSNLLGKSIECLVLDGATIERKEKTKTFTISDDKINSYIDTVRSKKKENDKVVLKDGEHVDKYTGFSRMFANCDKDRVKMIIMSDGVAGGLPSHTDADEDSVANDLLSEDLPNPVGIVSELDETASKEVEKTIKEKYSPVYITTNAITLTNDIQVIVRFYGDPEVIHSNYDYEHTKACWSSWDNVLNIPKSVYECTMNKILKYTGSKYPICSVFRMRKFLERGWRINAGQILKMAFHINELNLKDIDVLEDQLVGVDSVYFNDLINQIRQQKERNPNFDWDFGYVVSIVNKIF